MAKNFSVALNMILNSAEYTASLKNIEKQTKEFGKTLEDLSNGVKSFLGLGAATLSVEGAIELLKKSFESTISSMETYDGILLAVTESSNLFFRTLQNGDWSNFFKNLGEAIRMAKEYNEAMIYIENKTRGNNVANSKDKATVSELRLQAAELSGSKNYEARLKILAQIEKIEDGILDRNLKLSAFNYNTQVDKLAKRGEGRGYNKDDVVDFAKFTSEGEQNVELVNKYYELKSELATAVKTALDAKTTPELNAAANEVEKIRSKIGDFNDAHPAVAHFRFLLSDINKDEIKAIADGAARMYDDITAANARKLKPIKQEAMLNKKSDADETKAAKERQDLLDKTGLLNELNAKLKEFIALKDQSTSLSGQFKYGLAVDALKEQIKELNAELERTIKKLNDSRLLKPKFSGAVSELPNNTPGLQSSSTINAQLDTQIKHATDIAKKNLQDLNDSITSAMNELVSGTFTKLGEAFGNMISSGDIGKSFGSFAKSVMGLVGQFLVNMGKALIAYGIAMQSFKSAISNPFLAIGAGIVLIAAGSALSSAAAAGPAGASSGGSSGSSGSSGYSTPSTVQANNNVVFEIHGSKLVGVLSNFDRKNKNIS